MKTTLLVLTLFCTQIAQAQFTFTKKADFPGGTRFKMLTQMLATKLYCGLGQDSTGAMHKDVWAYETSNNIWTHKADMPVSLRRNPVSCTIGGKMYAGFGYDGSASLKDWWVYNEATDTWTQKLAFPGVARYWSSMFEWNGKGYIVGGEQYNGSYTDYKDVWEYTPSSDTWVQKPDMPGAVRCHAFCQPVGSLVIYGLGEAANTTFHSDMYKYNCNTGSWSGIPPMPAATGLAGVDGDAWWSAAYGKKVLVMNIQVDATIDSLFKHIYVYDTSANTWTVYPFANKAGYRFTGVSGQSGAKAYVGVGYAPTPDYWFTDMWELNLAGLATEIEEHNPGLSEIKVFAISREVRTIIPEEIWRRGPVSIELFGVDGKKLIEAALQPGDVVHASQLPPGNYTYRLRLSGQYIKTGIIGIL